MSICRKCGGEVPDGTKEWPEMTAAEKREYFLHDVWLMLAVTALFVCFVISARQQEWLLATVACGAVLLALACVLNIARIIASTRRHHKRMPQEK